MAEAAGAEVDANPDAVLLVGEEVDVVVAGADGSQLGCGFAFQGRGGFEIPTGIVALKDRVLGGGIVFAAYAKADRGPDLVHDGLDAVAQRGAGHVEAYGFVAAGDVEAYSGGADGVFVGDDSSDGNGVA